jgi:hypothetical protein
VLLGGTLGFAFRGFHRDGLGFKKHQVLIHGWASLVTVWMVSRR